MKFDNCTELLFKIILSIIRQDFKHSIFIGYKILRFKDKSYIEQKHLKDLCMSSKRLSYRQFNLSLKVLETSEAIKIERIGVSNIVTLTVEGKKLSQELFKKREGKKS